MRLLMTFLNRMNYQRKLANRFSGYIVVYFVTGIVTAGGLTCPFLRVRGFRRIRTLFYECEGQGPAIRVPIMQHLKDSDLREAGLDLSGVPIPFACLPPTYTCTLPCARRYITHKRYPNKETKLARILFDVSVLAQFIPPPPAPTAEVVR
ncbi:hypothetical protein F4815DRAFT_459850 [Daldinia loculata]|nr:hypothetical protein F4815DRAFT_459850 [Daldinia loculata]